MATASVLGEPLADALPLAEALVDGVPPGVCVMVAVVDGDAVTVTVVVPPDEPEESVADGDVVGDPFASVVPDVLEEPGEVEVVEDDESEGDPDVDEDELEGDPDVEDVLLVATVSLSELLAVPLDGAPQAPRAVTETRQRGRRAYRRAVLAIGER